MQKKVPENTGRQGLRQRIFAWMYAHDSSEELELVDQHKRQIFAGLHGDVLEIGPGTGDNLTYFPPGIRWIGIEPNVYMHPHLRAAMDRAGFQGELRTATAERLPVPDASMDAVVSTFVQCSVTHPDETLREIIRVLRPGGQFVFLEHVIAPEGTGLRRTQRLIKPAWKLFTDGCNPDRDIEGSIRRAGFASVEVKSFRTPVPVVSPCIAGVATKAESS